MTIALSIVGNGFAAFCVWLTVRVINRRERWARMAALFLVTLLVYPLSFGPVCWLTTNDQSNAFGVVFRRAPNFYMPLGWFVNNGPRAVYSMAEWYAVIGIRDDIEAFLSAMDMEAFIASS
jgi:hypothetical protein